MNKKLFRVSFYVLLSLAAAGSFTGCKDYDDDINNLQSQIDAIGVSIGELQTKISSGTYIVNVVPAADGGLTVTLSNGQSYVVGQKGEAGTSWTIGADGFWYRNGEKTEYRAIGEQGPQGEQGEQGPAGPAGANGENGTNGENGKDGKSIYYVPNTQTGCWDLYQDGQLVEHTDISWVAAGAANALTSFFDGTTLTFSGVETGEKDADGKPVYKSVKIQVGPYVGSLEFIPSAFSSSAPYPTTDRPYFHINNYYSEDKYNPTTKDFILQTNLNKSNVVDFSFRVNPSEAYVYKFDQAEFIQRGLVSRANGDSYSLLNVQTTKVVEGDVTNTQYFTCSNGELNISATINNQSLIAGKENVVALKLKNGQTNYTVSDYISIKSSEINCALVDSARMKANPSMGIQTFYNRTKAIVNPEDETSAFIQQFVKLSDPANYEMVYDGELDLRKLPGLYSTTTGNQKFLTDLGIYGMSYTFTLPGAYNSDDVQGTNQQYFVDLDGSILKANSKNLVNGLTPAINREPVVRVDAFLADNSGNEVLVGSAYIKIKIVESSPTTPDVKGPIPCYVKPQEDPYIYKNLKDEYTTVSQMTWIDVNNDIYGKTGLNSSNFWSNYGGANKEYEVKISTYKDGKELELSKGTANADTPYTLTAGGIECETTLGSGDTQTSNIAFFVNNEVKTQNTYDNKDGKGAQYTVTITIPSNNIYARGNVVVTLVFYVKDVCQRFVYNDNYWVPELDGKDDVVVTKGKLVNDLWKLEMNISDVFRTIDNKDIFQYYNKPDISGVKNVKGINFAIVQQPTSKIVEYNSVDQVVALTAPLTTPSLFAKMQYEITLVNGEKCKFEFYILFKNPFEAVKGSAVEIDGNVLGTVTVNAAPQVKVKETLTNKVILEWSNSKGKLSLTDNANPFHIGMPKIEYDFVHDAEYEALVGSLGKDIIKINEDGVISYGSEATLQLFKTYNLKVKAIVKFANISQVDCEIDVVLKGNKK